MDLPRAWIYSAAIREGMSETLISRQARQTSWFPGNPIQSLGALPNC